ncbi:MAG TPA: hypothetical protein VEY11_03785 [Pyrinomonadaceae bacterium]|nr:hypothetical protein [Pyrinomonadaceae bacterium]
MSVLRAAASGLVGACALTLIHESARRALPAAPRMDVLGMRAIARSMRGVGQEPPPADELHALALVGDVVSNGLYYSLVGIGRPEGALLRGTLLGLAAGVGAVLLPEPLGLGHAPSARTPETKAMTIGWYLAGGVAAALAYRLLARRPGENRRGEPRRRGARR